KEWGSIEGYSALRRFKQRVEEKLLAAHAQNAMADAVKQSGKSAGDLSSVADVQIREIIVNQRQDFFMAVSNGGHMRHAPGVAPSGWPSFLSGLSSVSGALGSILTIGVAAGTVAASAGGVLLFAGGALGMYTAYDSFKNAKESHRQQLVEDKVKEELM